MVINACIDILSNHSVIKGMYYTNFVEKHMHKKIDRSETNKKSYIGQCKLFYPRTWIELAIFL